MTAQLALVAAMDLDGGVGREGRIPWSLPADLRWFKELTTGGAVCYGRKTAEILPLEGLPSRVNYLLSSSMPACYCQEVSVWARSVEEALWFHRRSKLEGPLFVIGGTRAWAEAFELARQGIPSLLYLTLVAGQYQCDTFFPLGHLSWRKMLQQGPYQIGPPPSTRQIWSNF